jgi:hypothetical protein
LPYTALRQHFNDAKKTLAMKRDHIRQRLAFFETSVEAAVNWIESYGKVVS